ncbi:NUDIX hydrolase [Rhodocaloribacter litoris]|uniref:NUDIX domain-containing protein n=1 Tax=Rhodocaloribacter litoris TaxID=2558931 RepID=UPI00141F5384|nr:NUDIX hydrolase [Rhodocaloribacter litoris]QXD14196.1 NUDIX hydrolase [Rhodocaloribacter litoris]GIV59931.1 MAG: NUDIX hydrolase [Rhodothermaceae bacterium]
MTDLQEKPLSSTPVYDGVLLKVRRDEVRLPDGGTSVREWIDHPGAAAVVPLFPDGTTLLVRQFRYPPRRTFLEVPAGKLDVAGEDPATVARRELEEETGYRAGRLTALGALYPCIGYSNEVIHFFLAEDLTAGERDLSDGEFLEPVPVLLAEAVAQARRGELHDMKTVAALLLAEAHLAGRASKP